MIALALAPLIVIPYLFSPTDPRAIGGGFGVYGIALLLWGLLKRPARRGQIRNCGIGVLMGLSAAYLTSPLWYTIANSAAGEKMLLLSVYFMAAVIGGALALEKPSHAGAMDEVLVPPITPKICDTSVLIDGRIADIADAGFIEGELIIPQFILRELQGIADSSDQLKRNRGRRGLDIVKRLQEISGVSVMIPATDYPEEREVDHKLILLATETNASLVTNDFNLNKLARVRSVKVLNLNDLVNALKTIFLPGEEITIMVSRAGKEHGQGIAYLDDGTMVVVDNGAHHVGHNVKVIVTNIHQTTAGRMIFTRFEEVSSKKGDDRLA